MSDQVTSSTLAGAGTGAASGAGVGTSISPGIGTAIGAIAGGILGAVSGNKKAKGDIKAREEEVARVQQREDTAIRRATTDSLAAGVDPRIQNQAPPSAGSAGVEPYQSADYMNDMVAAGGQLSQAFQSRMNETIEANKMAMGILNPGYDRFIADRQQKALDANNNIVDLLNAMKTTETVFNGTQTEQLQQYKHGASATSGFLQDSRVVDYLEAHQIDLLDHLTQKFGKKIDSNHSCWNVNGQMDLDIAGATINWLLDKVPFLPESAKKEIRNFVFFAFSKKTSDAKLPHVENHASFVPGLGLGPTDMYDESGAPLPPSNSGTAVDALSGGSSSRQFEKRFNPKTKEFETVPVTPDNGDVSSRQKQKQTQKSTTFGVGVSGGYESGESHSKESGSQDNDRTVQADPTKNWSKQLTKDVLSRVYWSLVNTDEWVSGTNATWKLDKTLSKPDLDTYYKMLAEYNQLVWQRSMYTNEAAIGFPEYAKDRWQPALDMVKLLKWNRGLGR